MNKSALISTYNKKNLGLICKILKKFKIQIISTGGTYNIINKLGYQSYKLSDITNFDEILDGRVKSLHPKIHGGILFKRKNKKHNNIIKKYNIPKIDFVIVNLYPFKEVINQKKSLATCIENIDIGGHSLIRAAAKNFHDVSIICDPSDYNKFVNEIIKNKGKTSLNFRKKMSQKAFHLILEYDKDITNWFGNFNVSRRKNNNFALRYGENPHQKAFLYNKYNGIKPLNCNQIHGKLLSYNNINDVNAALMCLSEFNKPTCIIIKHETPCCVASNKNILKAFKLSLECDKKSAFGGILALNKSVNVNIATKLNNIFLEVIVAPNFSLGALKILKKTSKVGIF